MRTDAPAALPLLTFIAALAATPLLASRSASLAAFLTLALLLGIIPRWRRMAGAALFAALGIALATNVIETRQATLRAFRQLEPDRFVTVEARIDHDWARRGESSVLRVARFRAAGHEYDESLAIYAGFDPPVIAMEELVRAEGFLRMNERGEFTMSVKSPVLLSYAGRLPSYSPAAWNRVIANRLRAHADDHPTEVALVEALVLGRGERLTDEVRESFKRGGTYHLLVFSGMQIAFAAALLAVALRWAGASRTSDWLLLAFAFGAPLFIGPAASVSRASVAIGLYSASRILKRPTSVENLFCVAALIRLIIEPRDLSDPSFHLTYAGAGALLFIGKAFGSRWLGHAAAAEIAITPLTLFHFHQYALGGSVLTLAMSPIIFVTLAVAAVACAFPTDAIFAIVGALHRLCVWMNGLVSPASGFFTAPRIEAMVAGYFSAGVALTFLRGRARGAAITLALLLPSLAALSQWALLRRVDEPRASFLDVGQGDSILMRWSSHAVIVDGGGRPNDWRFGESRLLPLLLDRGVSRLDAVLLTHAHPDHCAGLLAVITHLEVGELWISPRQFRGACAARMIERIGESGVAVRLLREPFTRDADGVRITALPPSRSFRQARENNASMAFLVETGGRRLLLTGDAQAEREIELSESPIRADVLKVPHHGSRSSTSARLLDAVEPRLAVISCGRKNLFGNPHRDVLDSLTGRGVRIWRTDRSGTIDVTLSSGRIFVRPEIDTPPPRS